MIKSIFKSALWSLYNKKSAYYSDSIGNIINYSQSEDSFMNTTYREPK